MLDLFAFCVQIAHYFILGQKFSAIFPCIKSEMCGTFPQFSNFMWPKELLLFTNLLKSNFIGNHSTMSSLNATAFLYILQLASLYFTDIAYALMLFRLQEDILAIFEAADKDKNGKLSLEEFQSVIDDIIMRYPQVELYMKNHHLLDVTQLLKDPKGNDRLEVDIEEFKLALCHVDSQVKSLPATAQVLGMFTK